MKRKFFTAGEWVPVIERGWPNPEENVVVRYSLREEEVKIVNGALALLYSEMDEEEATPPAGTEPRYVVGIQGDDAEFCCVVDRVIGAPLIAQFSREADGDDFRRQAQEEADQFNKIEDARLAKVRKLVREEEK
jgi:hypothetical protein